MRRVYVAGPYILGDMAVNIRNAILAGDRLAQAGCEPFIPHLMHFWNLLSPHDQEFWCEQSLRWLEVCDGLLRLRGESAGADREVERARELGIPVYQSVVEILREVTKC